MMRKAKRYAWLCLCGWGLWAMLLFFSPRCCAQSQTAGWREAPQHYFAGPRAGFAMSMDLYTRLEGRMGLMPGYNLGGELIKKFDGEWELDLAVQMLWKGGTTTQSLQNPGGALRAVTTSTRVLCVNLPIMANYRYDINDEYSLIVGAGLAFNWVFMGKMETTIDGKELKRDMSIGFSKKNHIRPFDLGPVLQFGARYDDFIQAVLWAEMGLLNSNPDYRATTPDLRDERALRYESTRQLLQSFGQRFSVAFGVTVTVLFAL